MNQSTVAADLPAVVFVEVLTDEELSVVAAPGPMPMMPFLDDLPEAEREIARRSAYRGLQARGIVDPPTPEALAEAVALRTGAVELMVRSDIASVVALRAEPQVVVAVARTVVTGQDFWYAHVVEDVVLLEEVSGNGLHRFALAEGEDLVDLVLGAVVHGEAGDAFGEPVVGTAGHGDPTPPDEVLTSLGAAFVRADLVVRRPGDSEPPILTVFSGPGGCWVVRASEFQVVAEPVTAATARSLVAGAVTSVRAEAVMLGGR